MTDTDTWETMTGCRPLRSCWHFAFLYDYWLRRWKVTGSNLSYMYKYGFLFILSRNRTPRGVACTSSIFKPIYLYNNNLTNITEQLLKLSVFKILLKRKWSLLDLCRNYLTGSIFMNRNKHVFRHTKLNSILKIHILQKCFSYRVVMLKKQQRTSCF